MRFALVNPPWQFQGSIYFGCREPHLPLEFGYAQALLQARGHEVLLVDGQLEGNTPDEIGTRVSEYRPDFTVITTAPSYLFWRCAPPELRDPQRVVRCLRNVGTLVVVGPHASTTPRATLHKLGADLAIRGECEEVLVELAESRDRSSISSLAYFRDGKTVVQGGLHASAIDKLPALHWPDHLLARHRHHHHRFDAAPAAPGAEVEATRGCPFDCSFCAKQNFRNAFRRRPVPVVLDEIDGLVRQGVEYVYFIDEIFLPNKELLAGLCDRPIRFGVQMRIDLWSHEMLDLLGRAGCVSIEAGVESITPQGRDLLDKDCKLSTAELTERLIRAKKSVPFVQANLIDAGTDPPDAIEAWRAELQRHGVWANKPVPMFPYPGSPAYGKRWGPADDLAWERAHEHYLGQNTAFSDVQNDHPLPLRELELPRADIEEDHRCSSAC